MKSNSYTISDVHIITRIILVVSIFMLLVNITSAGGLEPPLKVAGKYRLGLSSTDIGPQSIHVIVSDIAFVDYGGLRAININDGKVIWSKNWSASVTYRDGVMYAAREHSASLYALNASTGEEIWKKEFPEYDDLMRNYFSIGHRISILNETLFISAGVYIPEAASPDMKSVPQGHHVSFVQAFDMEGNLKWQKNYSKATEIFEIVSKNIMIHYGTSSEDFTNYRNNLFALDSTTGETVWEVRNISFEGKSYSYKDMFFIDRLRENDSHENFFIQAISGATGETIWKKRIGDFYGNILTVKDNKLFVYSDKIKVLDPGTGEILYEQSNNVDPNSFGSILGLPGLLGYNSVAISDHIIYAATTGPSPSIYSIDLNTGNLLWKGGKGGISPYIYKDRLYLILFGQLVVYEHGIEEKNEEARFNYFVMLGVPLILINLFIHAKKYSGRLHQSFKFSSILILIVFLLILTSGILSEQYINLMDERLIISTPPDWMLFLLFPTISVIAGTLAGMRFENKFLISAAAGVAPIILAVAVSFLFLSMSDKIIILLSMVPLFLFIPIIIHISLFYGMIGSIIGQSLKLLKGSKN